MRTSSGHSYRLVEALATQIMADLFDEFPEVEAVLLRVQKLNPPMNAIVASAGIELYRTRDEMSAPPRVRLTVVGSDEEKEILAVEESE
jgi:hypothetical protein